MVLIIACVCDALQLRMVDSSKPSYPCNPVHRRLFVGASDTPDSGWCLIPCLSSVMYVCHAVGSTFSPFQPGTAKHCDSELRTQPVVVRPPRMQPTLHMAPVSAVGSPQVGLIGQYQNILEKSCCPLHVSIRSLATISRLCWRPLPGPRANVRSWVPHNQPRTIRNGAN